MRRTIAATAAALTLTLTGCLPEAQPAATSQPEPTTQAEERTTRPAPEPTTRPAPAPRPTPRPAPAPAPARTVDEEATLILLELAWMRQSEESKTNICLLYLIDPAELHRIMSEPSPEITRALSDEFFGGVC